MTGSIVPTWPGEGGAPGMHEPPTFELRLTTPNGEQLQVGPVATPAEVNALAHAYLGDGRAIRVEVYGRRRGRWRLLDVIGRATPGSRPNDAAREG
jgi:hypothetical protein